MEEIKLFLIRLGVAFVGASLIGAASYGMANRKGRDTLGWYLASFFPALLGALILLVATTQRIGWCLPGILVTLVAPGILFCLPSIVTQGQTKRCTDCGKIIGWKVASCPSCGAPAEVPESKVGIKVRRPLRSCFLYLFLFILLVLIVFGLIGYFCVPDEPRVSSRWTDLTVS